jgi:hypothetical protein
MVLLRLAKVCSVRSHPETAAKWLCAVSVEDSISVEGVMAFEAPTTSSGMKSSFIVLFTGNRGHFILIGRKPRAYNSGTFGIGT